MLNGQANRYALVEFFLRSTVTALLALGITGAAIYEVIVQHTNDSPIVTWAALIVGVYFGAQVATRGEERRRAADRDNGQQEHGN